MIHFKNVTKIFFLPFLIMLLICSCGNDGKNTQTTPAPEKVAKVEAPKVVEASLPIAEKTPEPAVAKVAPPVEETPKVEPPKVKKPSKPVKKPRAKMVFDQPTHDYGFIMQGDKVKHEFHFKNIGDDDLLITRVNASCGCTTPLYPREVIPPGGSGKIGVVFNSSGKLGRQNPTVDVYTNYQRKLTVKLKGFVDAERAKPPTVIKEKVEEVIDEKTKVEVDTSIGGL